MKNIKPRTTSYELGLFVDGKQILRLAFTDQKTKRKIYHVIMNHRENILKLIGGSYRSQEFHDTPDGVISADRHVEIKFTGRTERDCAVN